MASLTMTPTRLRLSSRLQVRPPASSTPAHRPSLLHRTPQPQSHHHSHLQHSSYSTTRSIPRPKIAQASFWNSLIPKFLRNRTPASASPSNTAPKSKEWNPASFYIIIFILIGSQAIRMIQLKNEYTSYTRSTDAKIRLLREVIEKVKAGEVVDVEKLLGKGDEGVEREWEEVLKEIEQEDSLWHRKRKEAEESRQEQEKQETTAEAKVVSTDPVVPAVDTNATVGGEQGSVNDATKRKIGFF
ncbi:hypothetical protein BJY01DRAFT_230061 [Aspergillus pseudoustus]|uniref:Uncharacterized protein n=1 Tax=Aspergillus pseudoustus TaxID=1810923 RepID=A0ABR4ID96_9EURO